MMKRVGLKMSSLLLGASALIGASCESTTKVGSECRDGVCPRANSVTQQTCLMSTLSGAIGIVNDDENPNESDIRERDAICIGRALPLDEHGKVACEVRWLLGAGGVEPPSSAPKRCSDAPFLEPAAPGVSDECLVAQRTADEVLAGGDGWFYDNNSESCAAYSSAGIRFSRSALPPTGTILEFSCKQAQTIDADGELVGIDADECERADSETFDIGAACLPTATPAGGFDPREASVEIRSDQCESEVCLVYALDGQPRPECKASEIDDCVQAPVRAAPAEEIERSIYCSCRCDAPEGDPGPLCECSEGFSCVPVLEDAPEGIRGSYCVSNASLPGLP